MVNWLKLSMQLGSARVRVPLWLTEELEELATTGTINTPAVPNSKTAMTTPSLFERDPNCREFCLRSVL